MAKRTILVVDDEPDFIDLVRVRLEANGYSIISANDGEEAVRSAKKNKPDLIFLDLVMPKSNGLEALSHLKFDLETSSIPVVIITAKSESEYAMDAGKLGASDYLVKPVSLESLLDIVRKYLG